MMINFLSVSFVIRHVVFRQKPAAVIFNAPLQHDSSHNIVHPHRFNSTHCLAEKEIRKLLFANIKFDTVSSAIR